MKLLKFLRFRLIIGLFAVLIILSGCAEKTTFKKGDIKNSFCGVAINYQYCKCAFHNDYCDEIGMKKGEAKNYVNEQYDKWTESQFEKYKNSCRAGNGIVKGKSCVQCDLGEVSQDDKCISVDDVELDEEDDDEMVDEGEKGECKYDSDCDPICEGDIMWKMGCNARTDICEKTFDTDCGADIENFGEQNFPKMCSAGECVRDTDSIEAAKTALTEDKKMWSDTVKEINSVRDGIRDAMLDANKNCINGIADMTNVAIIEFSTRIASVLAGGIPDIAAITASAADEAAGLIGEHVKNLTSAAVDYVGDGLNKLYNYQSGVPVEEEKKLAPHEYIKLNCDLYDYFKGVQAESDADLQTALDNANRVDQLLQELP